MMNWAPRREGAPGHEVLEGRHVRLVPVDWPEPAGALCEAMAAEDEALWRWMGWGPFANAAAFAEALKRNEARGWRAMALMLPGGRPVGTASFMHLDQENGVCEIGSVAFGAALQRSRAGTEAIYLMLRHVFDDFGWRRTEWICNARNERSFRAGQRYGFTYEGTLRQHRWVKGENRDTKMASMLDGEWPERKRLFEAWLDDANFDAEGRQIRRLGEA